MANVKITELTALTDPASTDVLPIVDVLADVTKKISIADLLENAGSGTAAAPGIAFDGDSNTGIYRPGADQVAFATDGTGRLFIDATGKVGIGTSSPGAPVDINLAADRGIQATASASSPSFIRSYQGEVSNNIRDIGLQGFSIIFETGPNTGSTTTESARIDSNGRLLVGTSTSRSTGAEKLVQIEGTSADTTGLSIIRNSNDIFGSEIRLGKSRATSNNISTIISDDDTLAQISFSAADGVDINSVSASISAQVDGTPGADDTPGRLVFSTTADGASSPTERMRITNEGKVGIGTSSPSAPVDINLAADRGVQATASASGPSFIRSYQGEVSNNIRDIGLQGFSIIFETGPNTGSTTTESARIDPSGRLLVGTSAQSGGSLLQVNDDRIRIASSKTPASASDTGTAGEICWDSSYIYVCTGTDRWKRAALSTW